MKKEHPGEGNDHHVTDLELTEGFRDVTAMVTLATVCGWGVGRQKPGWGGWRKRCFGCCLVPKLCRLLCDPTACVLPGSSGHEILQARTLEWIALSFARGSSRPGDQALPPALVGRLFTAELPGKPWRRNEERDLEQRQRSARVYCQEKGRDEAAIGKEWRSRVAVCFLTLSWILSVRY